MSVVYSNIEKNSKEEEGKECAICKKKLKLNEFFVQCSSCNTFYHYNHIRDWLNSESSCPVCKNTLIILEIDDDEIEIEDLVPDENVDPTKIDGILVDEYKLVFFNPDLKPKISSLLAQILIFILALVPFTFAIIEISFFIKTAIQYGHYVRNWESFILVTLLLITSCLIFYVGLRNNSLFLNSNWQNIILDSGKIEINSKKKPFVNYIEPKEEIKKVRFDLYEDELDIENETLDDLYCLQLDIILTNKRKYFFKKFFCNTSSANSKKVLEMTKDFFEQHYSIEISQITEDDKKRKERMRILLIFIGAIFLVSVLLFIMSNTFL